METQIPQTQPLEVLKRIVKKRVIEPKLIEISRKTYRVIRSFVESSSKNGYEWNIGLQINQNSVLFTKHGKWNLLIYQDDSVHIELCGTKLSEVVLEVNNKKLKIEGYEFNIDDLETLMSIAFVSALRQPFDRPISLYEIVSKLREYVSI